MPTYPEYLIRRFPEARRPRSLTVKPKATKPCIVSLIQRAADRQAAMVIGFARLDRREGR